MRNLSREEKEKLYIEKMTELQVRWGNPVDNDYGFNDWTDEQLGNGLDDIIGQLKFEKSLSFIKKLFLFLVWIFVVSDYLFLELVNYSKRSSRVNFNIVKSIRITLQCLIDMGSNSSWSAKVGRQTHRKTTCHKQVVGFDFTS